MLDRVKVLLLEDDPDSRELVETFFMACGAEVRATTSGSEGYQVFTAFRPDVVVSDIPMPGEDGLSFIRRVRRLPADLGGLTPAIAVLGGTTERETIGAGFHLHIAKPFDPSELLNAIRRFANASDEGALSFSFAPFQ